jgi:hypothetical protein
MTRDIADAIEAAGQGRRREGSRLGAETPRRNSDGGFDWPSQPMAMPSAARLSRKRSSIANNYWSRKVNAPAGPQWNNGRVAAGFGRCRTFSKRSLDEWAARPPHPGIVRRGCRRTHLGYELRDVSVGSTAPDHSGGCYVRKTPDLIHPVPTTRFPYSADLDRIGRKSFGSAVAWKNFRTFGRSNA